MNCRVFASKTMPYIANAVTGLGYFSKTSTWVMVKRKEQAAYTKWFSKAIFMRFAVELTPSLRIIFFR